jgi:putative lipoic acid-binding regulatory protein
MTNNELHAERGDLIEAMKQAYAFPGFYPVTLIVGTYENFMEFLDAALRFIQDGRDYRVNIRESRKGAYKSYRIEIFVDSAEMALEHKEFLRTLDGVLYTL